MTGAVMSARAAAEVRVALISSASGFSDIASPAATTATRKRANASAAAAPASASPATWRQYATTEGPRTAQSAASAAGSPSRTPVGVTVADTYVQASVSGRRRRVEIPQRGRCGGPRPAPGDADRAARSTVGRSCGCCLSLTSGRSCRRRSSSTSCRPCAGSATRCGCRRPSPRRTPTPRLRTTSTSTSSRTTCAGAVCATCSGSPGVARSRARATWRAGDAGRARSGRGRCARWHPARDASSSAATSTCTPISPPGRRLTPCASRGSPGARSASPRTPTTSS